MNVSMNQPELGKKIADLRKAKGLTQDELVEKCNISVRTLQRIESGEVMPRNYTVKLIFTALDYEGETLTEEKNKTSVGFTSVISQRLEQFYGYLLDLLNLKKETMKKLSILSLLTIVGLCFVFTSRSQAQDNKQLAGTWKLEKAIYNGSDFTWQGESFKKLSADGTFENYQIMNGQKRTRETGNFTTADGAFYLEIFRKKSDGKESNDVAVYRYALKGDELTIFGNLYLPMDASGNLLQKWVIKETWKRVK